MAWPGCYWCQYTSLQAVGLIIPLWNIETVHIYLALPWLIERRLWRVYKNVVTALDDSSTWDKWSKKLYFIYCSNLKQCYQTSPSLSHPTSIMPSAIFADHPCTILQVLREYISIQINSWMNGRKESECTKVIDALGPPSSTLKSRLRRDFSQQKDGAIRKGFNPCPRPTLPWYRSLLSRLGIWTNTIGTAWAGWLATRRSMSFSAR